MRMGALEYSRAINTAETAQTYKHSLVNGHHSYHALKLSRNKSVRNTVSKAIARGMQFILTRLKVTGCNVLP